MVYYFTLESDPSVMCYMGRDKYENEYLIKYGWPEDYWFHVDNHSSAHVYVRLPKGKTIADLTEPMIEECCQLTKANSIEGCKLNNVRVVYTPWTNLKKTNGMDDGQVGFHSEKLRFYHTVEKKNNAILNKLEKTKIEKNDVDFKALREARDAEERKNDKHEMLKAKAEEEKKREDLKRQDDILHYRDVMTDKAVRHAPVDEDDFM